MQPPPPPPTGPRYTCIREKCHLEFTGMSSPQGATEIEDRSINNIFYIDYYCAKQSLINKIIVEVYCISRIVWAKSREGAGESILLWHILLHTNTNESEMIMVRP